MLTNIAKWKNSSKVEILVGAVSGRGGPHPYKVHEDEIELIDEDVWLEAKNMERDVD
jgi:hypothetical protein